MLSSGCFPHAGLFCGVCIEWKLAASYLDAVFLERVSEHGDSIQGVGEMSDRKWCESCKRDLSTSAGVMAWRLHLGSEPIPMGGAVATMDIYIPPHMEKDCYFCGFGCLKTWTERDTKANG